MALPFLSDMFLGDEDWLETIYPIPTPPLKFKFEPLMSLT